MMNDDVEPKDDFNAWTEYCALRRSLRGRAIPLGYTEDTFRQHPQSPLPESFYHGSVSPHQESIYKVEVSIPPAMFQRISSHDQQTRVPQRHDEWNVSSTTPSLSESEISGDYSDPDLCLSPNISPHDHGRLRENQLYQNPHAYGNPRGRDGSGFSNPERYDYHCHPHIPDGGLPCPSVWGPQFSRAEFRSHLSKKNTPPVIDHILVTTKMA
jgi:hypothetical protein